MRPAGRTPNGFWGSYKRTTSSEAEEEGGPWLNLWLGNVSYDTVDDDLMAVFSKYGAMDSVTSYFPRPYAFVYFKTIDDAKAARNALQGVVIGGKSIRVEFARPAKPGKTLWAGGISKAVTHEQLEDIFAKFGEIEELRYLRHRGSAFICFYRLEDAVAAQKSMNWKHIDGDEIRVDFQRLPLLKKYDPNGTKKDEQPSSVLWVGFPPELHINEELLHNSMILFGEIERIQSFPSRNYCYVEFRSADEARRAKEGLQGRLLGDSRIQISFSNSELMQFGEKLSIYTPDFFANEPHSGPAEIFGPVHSLPSNRFQGPLIPNLMPRPNLLAHPFAQGFNQIHGFPDNIAHNQFGANSKRMHHSGPFRPLPGLQNEFDSRELKKSKIDPWNEARFHGGLGDGDDMPNFSDKQSSYYWRGIIAKGGTPVCRARCLPIGNGIETHLPVTVNCSARTGLDMLTTHYSEAVGYEMVYFLPDTDEDFASYTEFLRYLGQRNRAGVAKFDDGTTMFLVPPSDFLLNVLKYSGPDRLYGVVLKLPHQVTATGQQTQAIKPPPETRSHNFIAEETAVQKIHESTSYSQAGISLTPELIATLASLLPTSSHLSGAIPSQINSASFSLPPADDNSLLLQASFPAPPANDNPILVQRWGQEGRFAFSSTSVDQLYNNPMPNFPAPPPPPPPLPQYASQDSYAQFSNYATNIPNGLDSSFQPPMSGMPATQEFSFHMPQDSGYVGMVGNAASSQIGQFQALQSSHSADMAGVYGWSSHQQITAANPAVTYNENVLQVPVDMPSNDRINTDFAGQVQVLQPVILGSGQASSQADVDKDQRYHSTLQFAASLLLQIQQQQAISQAAMGSGNRQ